MDAGVKRFALVTAASGLGKLTVEDVINLVDNRGLLMRGFDSLDEAQKWLAEANRASRSLSAGACKTLWSAHLH